MDRNGGYDEGYRGSRCFWGRRPASLVKAIIAERSVAGLSVLDLGCGEGKNAFALAEAGANVCAVDCSRAALENGQRELNHQRIRWHLSDAVEFLEHKDIFDIVVMYGLLHCLESTTDIEAVIRKALSRTRAGGLNATVTFNDGPHDLSAHPGFSPTLLPHSFYADQYQRHEILVEENEIIHETHPHNNIEHFHSLSRFLVRKKS
jgi:tellurite methyltransferase